MQPPFLPVYIVWVPVYRVSGAPCISDEFRRFYKGFAVLGVSTETRRVTRRNIHMSCVRSSADANQACYEVLTCDISTAGSTSTPNRTLKPPALGAENFQHRHFLHPPRDGPRKLLSQGVKTQGKTPRGIGTAGSFVILISKIGFIVAAFFLFKRSAARLVSLFGVLLQPSVKMFCCRRICRFSKNGSLGCAFSPTLTALPYPQSRQAQQNAAGRAQDINFHIAPGRPPAGDRALEALIQQGDGGGKTKR